MRRFVAQFATTTSTEAVRVWGWACREVHNQDFAKRGTDIIEFIDLFSDPNLNGKVYVHNLKYYGQFIIYSLMDAGFTCAINEDEIKDLSFAPLAASNTELFKIEIYFTYNKGESGKKKVNRIVLLDSSKLINASISDINRDFGLNIDLVPIPDKTDYDVLYEPTGTEWQAIESNLEVILRGIEEAVDMGLTGMTIGACALSSFKYGMFHNEFTRLFPVLDQNIDDQIRRAYRGGYCTLNPLYRNKDVGQGITIDKNSMYPSKMCSGNWIPCGIPEYYEGRYQDDKAYPLYIQTIKCRFLLKQGKLPCVQIRNSFTFIPTMWQESSDGEIVVLTLTSVDLKLFLENYDVWDLDYIDGWKFQATKGVFNNFVRKWTGLKIISKQEGNKSKYELSKRVLNSLYGKLATNTRRINTYPVFDRRRGLVHYDTADLTIIDPVYTAAGAFITSYARADVIKTAEAIREYSIKKYGEDRFLYIDTDCVKALLTREDIYELSDAGVIKLDDTRLGYYKIEDEFIKARFLKPKCYIEIFDDDSKKVCVAGLPRNVGKHELDWSSFHIGWSTEQLTEDQKLALGCKTVYRLVKGGCIMEAEDYSILS